MHYLYSILNNSKTSEVFICQIMNFTSYNTASRKILLGKILFETIEISTGKQELHTYKIHTYFGVYGSIRFTLLPPTYKVWGKVIFSQVSVYLQGGLYPGDLPPRGSLSLCQGSLWNGVSVKGGSLWRVDLCEKGVSVKGGSLRKGTENPPHTHTPPVATEAGSTHPAGIHTCFCKLFGNTYSDTITLIIFLPSMVSPCRTSFRCFYFIKLWSLPS